MPRIVIYRHRPTRPRKKVKAATITGPAIVTVASEKHVKLLRAERARPTAIPVDVLTRMCYLVLLALVSVSFEGEKRDGAESAE